MTGTVRIGRIKGIPVGVHWSLLAIGALLSFDLATGLLPATHPGRPGLEYWAAGAIATVLFFGAVLAHEIGHALVALRHGVGVEGIDLWVLGGMARLTDEAPTPRSEFRIAAAGPLVSLALTVLFAAGAFGLHVWTGPGLASAALGWLALVNGILTVFNLLPAAPLDGGRILTAWLWSRNGDRVRSTTISSQAGQFLGWLLIAWGAIGFLYGSGNIFTAFVGWFLLTAARQEAEGARARAAIAGLTVADVAWFGLARAPEAMDAGTMLWERSRMGDVGLVAIERPDGTIRGLATERQLWRIPDGELFATTVATVATPIERFGRTTPGEPLVRALLRFRPLAPLLTVWDGGRLVGVVTTQAVERMVDEKLGQSEPGRRADSWSGSPL